VKRRRFAGCSPVERAIIAQQWEDTAVRAEYERLKAMKSIRDNDQPTPKP